MSCWVTPLIAAEYWCISIDAVTRQIDNGTLPVRRENGFLFVDVLPEVDGPPAIEPSPLTYVSTDPTDADDDGIASSDLDISWKTARRSAATRRRAPIAA